MADGQGVHLVSHKDEFQQDVTWDVPRPNYDIGNARHWPKGISSQWQLRPAEKSDLPYGVQWVPGNWLLAREMPHAGACYICVRIPPHRRRNTPANIAAVLKTQRRRNPETFAYAEMQEKISKAVSTIRMQTS